jgi:hypothetical protein
MSLDDLMAVWRSQDAAPLHDVNRTLLHLALRQDEVKLQNRRRQARREQRFGESLRDQLNRRIAQLDYAATTSTGHLVMVLLGGIGPIAILLLGFRVNQKSFSDEGFLIVGMILMCVASVAAGVWEIRRQVQKDVLPRRRRLEALLKEIDGE